MKPYELEILKEELGLTGFDDPDAFAAIQAKLESMNALDRVAVQMNIRRNSKRPRPNFRANPARRPRVLFWRSPDFALRCAGLAAFITAKTDIWIGFKILAGIVGVSFFVVACAGFRRFVHRIVNDRDLQATLDSIFWRNANGVTIMKRKDVMFTIFSEISGKRVEEIRETFPPALKTGAMEEELTDEEATKLLGELRIEKAGIRKWMEQGLMRGIAKSN